MKNVLLFDFDVDRSNKKINVKRAFDAPRDMVWDAWTKSEILDQWWAPKPWKTETKHQDFKNGGNWLYAMVSPEGEKHWCLAEYSKIDPKNTFSAFDAFCDSEGNISDTMPRSNWTNNFRSEGDTTVVDITITYNKVEDLEKYIEMGFKEGFTMGLENLDHWLSTHFMLRKQNKTGNAALVTTYLNFPGKTEEAFNFYKKVFNGEFTGVGLRRFGDIEMPADSHGPNMSEADKKLIIHAELSILGGHKLMATDAPESMGFKMEYGNNMHINVEPESREETERIFNELSEGGTVEMPLADMFWGAYFGSFRDKYGINWMLHYNG